MTDDETQGIVLSAATLTELEAGSAAYKVKLASEPVGSSVTVTLGRRRQRPDGGHRQRHQRRPDHLTFTAG